MALRHAAVLRNPGSYVMSPASSADVLICRRSTARIVPSWTGISYCLAVRLSTTVRVSLGTRGILDFGWGKITSAGLGTTGKDGERRGKTGKDGERRGRTEEVANRPAPR